MNILIRAESEADWPVIRAVTTLAFSGKPYAGGNEADIIDALRREGALTFSFVAVVADNIVGHVAFSPATSSNGGERWFALGPVAVHPAAQRRGVGTKLIERGLKALTEIGASGCILVGSPDYYKRFGFVNVPELAPAGEPAESFLVKLLKGAMPNEPIGFHAAFYTHS